MIAFNLLSTALYYLTTFDSVYKTRGFRILSSFGLSYIYKAVFFKPYVVLDAKSMTPVTGLTTRPVTP
jgi:hypothetical protein